MADHSICRMMLSQAKGSLPKDFLPELRGVYVEQTTMLNNSKWFWVKDAHGNVLWEGRACCSWSARYHQLDKMMDSIDSSMPGAPMADGRAYLED